MQAAYVLRLVLLASASSWVVGLKHDDVARKDLPQYNEKCMMCLCEAAGKNQECVSDMRQKCVHLNTHGPFCISEPFWIDAGKPVLPGDDKDLPGAFLRCVEEPFCAVETIRGYMETGPGLQDCDKNGIFDCRDLILTHLHGRYNCKDEPDKRVTQLEKCMGDTLFRPTTVLPLPATSASGRAQPSSQGGGRGSGSIDSYDSSRGTGFPDNSWPENSYGRGGFGNGEFGIPRNIPRDSFNALHSGSWVPGSRVLPEDAIINSRTHADIMRHNMKEMQDMVDFATRRAQDGVRNTFMRLDPNRFFDSATDSASGDSSDD